MTGSRFLLPTLALLLAATPAAAEWIVDLDASVHSHASPVLLELPAGTWSITPVGPDEGGAFDAWHPWGWNQGCDGSGTCERGWGHSYEFRSEEHAPKEVRTEVFYQDAADALANARSEKLELSWAQTVEFCIPDDPDQLFDNLGGVSLRISADAVPVEGSSWGAVKALW